MSIEERDEKDNIATEHIIEKLTKLKDEGTLSTDDIREAAFNNLEAEGDVLPILKAVDTLGLWSLWHKTIDEENELYRKRKPRKRYFGINTSYIMRESEKLYIAEKRMEKKLDTVLGNAEGMLLFTAHSTFEEQIILTNTALTQGKKDKLLSTVSAVEDFIRDLVTRYGNVTAEDDLGVAVQFMELYEMFIERIENGQSVPPSKEEIHEWLIKRDREDFITKEATKQTGDMYNIDLHQAWAGQILKKKPEDFLNFIMSGSNKDKEMLIVSCVAFGLDDILISHLDTLIDYMEEHKDELSDDTGTDKETVGWIIDTLHSYKNAVIENRQLADKERKHKKADDRLKGLLGI